jgi:hypothetical protein
MSGLSTAANGGGKVRSWDPRATHCDLLPLSHRGLVIPDIRLTLSASVPSFGTLHNHSTFVGLNISIFVAHFITTYRKV